MDRRMCLLTEIKFLEPSATVGQMLYSAAEVHSSV